MFERAKGLFLKVFPGRKIDYLILIPKGYSNKTFRVSSEGESFRVRVGCNNNIISRDNEYLILEALGNDGCYFFDRGSGDGIWKWIDGISISKSNLNLSFLVNLYGEIKRIHDIDSVKLSGILEHDDLEFFEERKGDLGDDIEDLYFELVRKNRGGKRCLCHNDISFSNIIYDQDIKRIHLIDYEWGRINSPYWDFGNLVKESDMDIDYVRYLSIIAGLNLKKLFEYCFMAAVYSHQLSFSFPQSKTLEEYRSRVRGLINKYRKWILRG